MPINTLIAILFLIVFIAFYITSRERYRLWTCLVGSLLFISFWDWRFAGILLVATFADYIIALSLSVSSNPRRKVLLVSSILFNVAMLGFFKYFNFFSNTLDEALNFMGLPGNLPTLDLILPLGISFYTFQKIGYVIDVYRKKIEVERNFLHLFVYTSFFPKIISGPIVPAGYFLPQLQTFPSISWEKTVSGLELLTWGVFKKFVIANTLSLVVDVYFANPAVQSSLALMIAALFYTFQIYCDFSGYTDMAIGFARVLGFDLNINFNYPYFATSFSDFWSRWHISLSSWFREYLYIPLGGNRRGSIRTYLNLLFTMLVCGLWHGANWTFIIWGGLHGFFLVLQRIFTDLRKQLLNGIPQLPYILSKGFSICFVFIMVSFAWIFFRAATITDALLIIHRICSLDSLSFSALTGRFLVVKGLFLILLLLSIEAAGYFNLKLGRSPSMRLVWNAILIWSIPLLGVFSDQMFIYSRF